MTPAELEAKVKALLELHLNLEYGEMMLPLKPPEIDALSQAIMWLVSDIAEQGPVR